jgi:hypothetical protein
MIADQSSDYWEKILCVPATFGIEHNTPSFIRKTPEAFRILPCSQNVAH